MYLRSVMYLRIGTLCCIASLTACGGSGDPAPTGPDTTPPTVLSTSPANAAIGVALNAAISATFSEAMTNSTLTIASFSLQTTAGTVAVAGTINVNNKTATLTPSAGLAAGTQ